MVGDITTDDWSAPVGQGLNTKDNITYNNSLGCHTRKYLNGGIKVVNIWPNKECRSEFKPRI